MDGSPSGLHDRLGSLSQQDSTSRSRDDASLPQVPEVLDNYAEPLVQRCVIIQRDEKGYGLTVSGDNPVFVQSVKEDGAAARAGVQQGDRIIKVNGTLATQCNHQEVVRLIKSGSYVALTLLGKQVGQSNRQLGSPQTLPHSGNAPTTHSHSATGMSRVISSPSERITGPQPVDPEKQQQLSNARIYTLRKMLEKEKIYLEKLHSEYSKTPSDKIKNEIHSAAKRVKTLEEQLLHLPLFNHDGAPRSPRSPPQPRHVLTESESFRSALGSQHGGRTLMHQASAPTLPKPDRPQQLSPVGDMCDPTMPAPPSPNHHVRGNRREAKHRHSPTQLPLSTSLENITKPSSPKSGPWFNSGPTHSRQSSNPDTLLHQVENMRQQRIDCQRSTDADGIGLTRTQSEITALPPGRKISASDMPSDRETSKKMRTSNSSSWGSSLGHGSSTFDSSAESPHDTPPSTPPLTDSQMESSDNPENVETDEFSNQEEPWIVKVEQPSAPPLSTIEGRPDPLNHIDSRPLPPIPMELKTAPSLTSASQQYGTPPESQVSPVGQIGRSAAQRPYIICMDDDDFPSDTEMGHIEDHGPFKSLWKLMRHQAHLAVFLHYLINNSDPSSLFFYIISDWYKEGTVKEMKKWAYEIHSTFLVPNAPLRVNNIDETILHEIDDVLQNYIEREDVLRVVFTKARNKAQEEINELLSAFCNKRTMGLGGIFGPPDYQLEEAENDKNKQLKIIEELLLLPLDTVSEDLDNANDKDLATASSLATILKQFGVKSPHAMTVIDRCPTFVAKDKTRLRFLKGNKKSSLQVIMCQGHQFLPQHYYCVTYCNHCQLIIWGVGNQGYQCQNCEMNIHKSCVKVVEEHCIGALRKKDRRNNRVSEIVENIIGKNRKPSQPIASAIERAKSRWNEEMIEGGLTALYGDDAERNACNRSDKQKERGELSGGEEQYPQNLTCGNELLDRNNGSKKGSSMGRSESFRQRRENRPSFRKRSDPNIPRSKSDVDVEDKQTNLNNSGSSSNSSLSARSLDSPSNSLEMVHRTPTGTPADSVPGSSPLVGPLSHVSSSSSSSTVHQYDDSDLEAEPDPPNWQDNVEWEVVRHMKPKEKKRQDVINELFHTERTHVRNLKVLDRLFYRPLLQEQNLPPDLVHLLFSNLEEMLDIHITFNNMMKAKRREEPVIGDIGEMMLSMFDSSSGENLKRIAASFCRNQSVALESLKNRQRKDQKLANFLSEAEAHHLCRRLQLKDIIATGFQRLTKYPLLLENIAKYTAQNSEEYTNLLKAVECSKQILNHVNQAVKEAENQHRLSELQRKIDKSAFEKVVEHQITHMYKNLDLTKHKLLHEGPLTWKVNKKSLDVHVVLLEDILVLLQKQDEKYILKFHSVNLMPGREETKFTHSPILRVQNLLPRNVATDKKSFFLLCTSEQQQAMYELSASSPSDRKIWLKHITEAAEAYKKNQNLEKVRDHSLLSQRTDSADETPEEPSDQRISEMNNGQNQPNQESNEAENGSDAGDQSDISTSTMQGAQTPTESPNAQEGSQTPSGQSPDISPQKEEASPRGQDRKTEPRFQHVEILKIADGPQLIEPQEVVVSYGAVLQTAEPVLTPVERLRRKDHQIATALKEKNELVADILQIPPEEFENVAEIASEMDQDKDMRELILAAVYQANRLDSLLNDTLRVTEEDAISASSVEMVPEEENTLVPTSSTPSPKVSKRKLLFPSPAPDKLINISTALNRQLTQLLGKITEREEERKQLQKELHNCREQLHQLHETHRRCTVRSQSPSNQSTCHSRPNSFISIASSVSESMCDPTELSQSLYPEDTVHKSCYESTVPRSDCKVSNPETSVPEQFEETAGQGDDSAGEMFLDALTDTPDHGSGRHSCQTTDLDHDLETECKNISHKDDPVEDSATTKTSKTDLQQAHATDSLEVDHETKGDVSEGIIEASPQEQTESASCEGNTEASETPDAVYF